MGFAPFPAPSSQTGHEVLPHPAFPWAVDRPHSPTPLGLATGPSDSRGSSTVSAVLAVAVAHPARGPSLRRVVLSTPILATTPSSDFRSTLHHFAGHAYRFRCYRSTRRRHPPGPCCRCRDGSLLFHDGLCDRSAPITPTGLWCCTSKVFTPSVAFAPICRARHPFVSRAAGWVTTRLQDSSRTDRPLARRPRRLCHGASTVGSLLPPAISYGAAWPLPRPDSHRQVHRSFQDTPDTPTAQRPSQTSHPPTRSPGTCRQGRAASISRVTVSAATWT